MGTDRLHTGSGRWRAPVRLEDLFAPVPKDLARYLPRLTYLLLDERRLNLDRPGLGRNPTAALFRVENNVSLEALPGLYRDLHRRLDPGDAALRRTLDAWFRAVVRRIFPDAIIPEGVQLEEAPMLEETLIKWRDTIRKEALQAGRKAGREEGRS